MKDNNGVLEYLPNFEGIGSDIATNISAKYTQGSLNISYSDGTTIKLLILNGEEL